MKKTTFRLLITILVFSVTTLACGGSREPAATSEPTIIYVPVTVTSEPPQQQPEQPAAEPTATLAPPTATTVAATATSDLLHFYVSGTVWLDTCKPQNPIPTPIPSGCLFDPIKGLYADGIYQAGEPGIAGVTIRLEIDCNYGAFTTTTDGSGYYSMSFTVPKSAGVSQQKICLSIDAISAQNAPILVPGGWTSPAVDTATALIQITIPVEQPNTVNFGWDYQFQ